MTDSSDAFIPTDRSRIRRSHEKARYDKETVYAIVDATPLCHVGYSIDGQPYVTPTLHWRVGDVLYWHGSSASRMLKPTKKGLPACVTITHFDGFVLARTSFEHTANFRTAMLYGTAKAMTDRDAKEEALRVMMEGLFPGRWAELRASTDQELKATTVVEMPIDDAAAKVRTGPPDDPEEDYATERVWAGVLPRHEIWGAPADDPRLLPGISLPDYLK
ncbi:MAG: flavin-nucleotide-binding protein [Rhodospirillales bacterium]|jgi:nitroimidazol reductase NimA-like FMN-containing flavoprotein (pyridoxamine 5'-phosphate oxidase superfamily)|uniref:pyridoxamine 5'-phosphate oxidase family protein n=1 Tax=Hwanghaeella sp. 1Z406 TaxID=3402811 RepID=UPI000C8F9874|nr:flavin-nucleotide-binding protein [Rhodospirillales bacterium]|tara:strand:- start:83991 stop:84644 length:654 start_codon:yes stop_codon:yes gene_type:complete